MDRRHPRRAQRRAGVPHPRTPHPGIGTRRPWSLQGLPRRYWRLIAIIGLFALVNFPDTLLLLRASDLGYDFAGLVALYVLYNLSYAALSYPAGAVSDRLSRCVVFAAGLGLFALAWGGDGRVPLLISGTATAGLAVALLVSRRRLDPTGPAVSA